MSGGDWIIDTELPVRLPSGGCIRLGDLTAATLPRIELDRQSASAREILAAMIAGFAEATHRMGRIDTT